MLIQTVRYTFASEDAARAEATFRELRVASRAEAGVLAFDVGRVVDDPNAFALWEVYVDRDALELHRQTEHFQRLVVNGIRMLAKERRGDMLSPI